MADLEKDFYELCKKHNDQKNNDFKGFLLFKSFKEQKCGEVLLANFVIDKSKFDSIFAVILTQTRIIEINTYSTMNIVSTLKFKQINKVIVQQEFDDKKVKEILKDEEYPERVQLKVQFVNSNNSIEELSWDNVDQIDNIKQVLNFANVIRQLQANE